MTIFITLAAKTGDIARWESGGLQMRLTHRACAGEAVTFTEQVLDEMRLNPPDEYKVAWRVDPPAILPTTVA